MLYPLVWGRGGLLWFAEVRVLVLSFFTFSLCYAGRTVHDEEARRAQAEKQAKWKEGAKKRRKEQPCGDNDDDGDEHA